MSGAAKDEKGEAEHRFMQNMTRLPSYFTLAFEQLTRHRVAKLLDLYWKWPKGEEGGIFILRPLDPSAPWT